MSKNKEWRAVPIEQFHYDTGIPMTEEEVQGLLQFRKRGYYIKNKKVTYNKKKTEQYGESPKYFFVFNKGFFDISEIVQHNH